MFHHGQRLLLGFKSSDDALGVHPQPDHFERDATADRLLLLSHIDHATPTLADLLQQFVASDSVPGMFSHGPDADGPAGPFGGNGRARHIYNWSLQEGVLLMISQQSFDGRSQPLVVATDAIQVSGPLLQCRLLQRFDEDLALVCGGGCWFAISRRHIRSYLS